MRVLCRHLRDLCCSERDVRENTCSTRLKRQEIGLCGRSTLTATRSSQSSRSLNAGTLVIHGTVPSLCRTRLLSSSRVACCMDHRARQGPLRDI